MQLHIWKAVSLLTDQLTLSNTDIIDDNYIAQNVNKTISMRNIDKCLQSPD